MSEQVHIIENIDQLEDLDMDTLLMATDVSDTVIMSQWDWLNDYQIDSQGIFPLGIIATGEQVRTLRQALERKENTDDQTI